MPRFAEAVCQAPVDNEGVWLTPRQVEILRLVADDLTNEQIAARLSGASGKNPALLWGRVPGSAARSLWSKMHAELGGCTTNPSQVNLKAAFGQRPRPYR